MSSVRKPSDSLYSIDLPPVMTSDQMIFICCIWDWFLLCANICGMAASGAKYAARRGITRRWQILRNHRILWPFGHRRVQYGHRGNQCFCIVVEWAGIKNVNAVKRHLIIQQPYKGSWNTSFVPRSDATIL